MISAVLKDELLLADVRAADRGDDQFRLWWLGQSGFLIQYRHEHLLFDPYLSDSLTKKYAETDKPHLRMTELPVSPEQLSFINVVTSSHRHTDHLDGDTLTPLMGVNSSMAMVMPRSQLEFAAKRLQVESSRFVGLDAGEHSRHGVFEIHAVTAAHNAMERDDAGNCLCLGLVVKFGPWAVYHSGDTIPHAGLVEQLQSFKIDLALLPINGNAPERRVAGNFWGNEAAELAHAVNASLVIPCHYEMFSFNSVTPDEFIQRCHQLEQPYAVLRAGMRWESVRLTPR